jgi:hypothetical protein
MPKQIKQMGAIFGNKPVGWRNVHENDPWNTGYSSANHGNVNIDPSIRALQDKGLGRIDELYNQTGSYGNELIGNSREMLKRYQGNMSDYAQAQLNPLQAQIAQGRGELQRGNSLRGLSGSSFGNQSMQNFDTGANRQLHDARAQIEAEQIQAQTGINGQMAQNMFAQIAQQSALNGESQQIAQQRLQQELAALGLGAQQIKMLQDSYDKFLQRDQDRRTAFGNQITSLAGGMMNMPGKSGGGPT